MKIQIIIVFIIFGLFIQCKNEKTKKVNSTKKEMISATNQYNYIGDASMKFQFFSDSSYVFTVQQKDFDHEKLERFKGFCYFKNDTLYFKPFEFKFDRRSEKAVIKNNFIEFINDESALKIEIKKNLFQTKNKLDLKKYNDYAFFSFNEGVDSPVYYGYKPKTIKAYDLKQNELIELDQILKRCFKENSSKLKNINKYLKQCIVVINDKQEKEVWVSCYCKGFNLKETYKYDLIRMNDGGNCNINLKINLTKHNYTDLNIAGQA
jgi:hypothetical protein